MKRAWLLAVAAAVLGLLFVDPVAHVLAAARGNPWPFFAHLAGGDACNGGHNALADDPWCWAAGPLVRGTLDVAVRQAALSTLLTLAAAMPLAWWHHTRRIRGQRVQLALHAAPFVMPVFVVVYGVQALLGPRGWLQQVAGGRDALSWLGPLGAVAVAHAYYNYGFAARMLHAALERRSRRLEEAAQGLGASRAQAFGRTTVPLLAPTFLAVALLVFLFCFASFGTVLLLGQGEVRTLETLLYGQVYSLFPDYPRAAVLGVLQLGLNAVLLASYLALRRRMHRLPREPAPVPPPASRTATAGSWLLVALAIAPMVAVLAGGFRLNGAWSLEPWRHLAFDHPGGFDLGRALGLSLFYALASTAAALALCAAVAYGAQRLGSWPRRAVEAAASLPMAASSVIVGLGMILAFGAGSAVESVFHYRFASTVWIVLAAQVVVGFPFAARALLPAFESHDTRLDEAASLLGASPRSIIARIHWPLFRGPLLVATGFCLAFSLGDFGASTMLAGTSTRGLAPWTNILDGAYNPLFHARATALAGLLGALAACAYLLVERAGRAAKEAL